MSQWQLKTAVAFFIFNRPDTTARVFEAIRRAAPPVLLIVADGPRPDRAGEAEKCAAARAVVAGVDWPCRVVTDFSDHNLGCRRRISTGLDWVFRNVEEAILLEDDCLPHPSFFRFCEELLERYRDDRRVMMISGDNFQGGGRRSRESYYFSRYPHIWGWACWRRSFELYDVEMKLWPRLRDQGWLEELFGDRRLARHWREAFQSVTSGRLDTWDHQFAFCCLVHDALCVVPGVNLVSNLGFRADATHTKASCEFAEMPVEAMEFPLRHPAEPLRDPRKDRTVEKGQMLPPGPVARIRRFLRHHFQRMIRRKAAATAAAGGAGACRGES